MYTWVGHQANQIESDRAMDTATKYVEAQAEVDGRPSDSPVVLVRAGAEPLPFTVHFVGWSDTAARAFEDPYEKRKRILAGQSAKTKAGGSAAPQAALKKTGTGLVPDAAEAAPMTDDSLAEQVVDSAIRKSFGGDETPADPAPAPTAAAGAAPSPPTVAKPVKSFVPTGLPEQVAPSQLPPPKKPVVEALNLGAIVKGEGGGGVDSARRRALAAGKAAASLGEVDFADPDTERFDYEEIKTNRTARTLNPVCRELYLGEEDFAKVFGMPKEEFYALKLWKQRELKKKAGLF